MIIYLFIYYLLLLFYLFINTDSQWLIDGLVYKYSREHAADNAPGVTVTPICVAMALAGTCQVNLWCFTYCWML